MAEPRDARRNNSERITAHLEKDGFDVNDRYARNNTLLMIAASSYSFETMEVLLRHGARQDLQNDRGETALMIIAKDKDSTKKDQINRAIRLLLEYGANLLNYKATLDLQEKHHGETALMIAAKNGKEDICKLLMNAGAGTHLRSNPTKIIKHGKSAQDFLLEACSGSELILQNSTPTSPRLVTLPILPEQQILQTEEDVLSAIIESIDTLLTFKIVFTLLTYLYNTNKLSSLDEYKGYVFKALHHTALKCISVRNDEFGIFKVCCLGYAIDKNLINEIQKANLIAKATNCELHQRIDSLESGIGVLANQLQITQRCLNEMQQKYKNNRRIKSGIAFTKAIVDILTFGMGGNLAEVIMNSIIDFGSIEHIQGIIKSESAIISNGNESKVPDFFYDGLESAEEHFSERLDDNIGETLNKFKRDSNSTTSNKKLFELIRFLKVSQKQIEIANTSHTGEKETKDPAPSFLCICCQEFHNNLHMETQQPGNNLSLLPVPVLEGKKIDKPTSKTSLSESLRYGIIHLNVFIFSMALALALIFIMVVRERYMVMISL